MDLDLLQHQLALVPADVEQRRGEHDCQVGQAHLVVVVVGGDEVEEAQQGEQHVAVDGRQQHHSPCTEKE